MTFSVNWRGSPAVVAQAGEEHGVLLTEVAHEDIRRIGICKYRAEVSIVDINPVFHSHVVSHLVAEHSAVELNPLVGMRPRYTQAMLISIVDVARAEKVASSVLLEKLRHAVFVAALKRRRMPNIEKGDAVLSELASLADDRALGCTPCRAEHRASCSRVRSREQG